mgnify:CR=1 FL=1
MPEGPQMVFLKEQASRFIGQKVLQTKGNAKGIPFDEINNQVLVDIRTFGKELLFCFEPFAVRIHLMLFGKYAINDELNRELRLGCEFEDGSINFYACECRFIREPLDEVYDWSVDVMNPAFDAATAATRLFAKPKALICEALLDQNILAGVGNKIKNEVLFRQQVHPASVTGDIPQEILEKLVKECVRLSSEYLGWKRDGTDSDHWMVYQRTECPRDHIPLLKEKIGKSSRSCYFCEKCQKLYDHDAD